MGTLYMDFNSSQLRSWEFCYSLNFHHLIFKQIFITHNDSTARKVSFVMMICSRSLANMINNYLFIQLKDSFFARQRS